MDRSRSTLAIQKALTEAITLGGLPAPPPAPPPPAQVVPQAPYQPALPPPIQKPPSPNGRNLELVFVHDCRNHGCNVPQCVLCKHNPNKRCQGNFAHKYWVGDKLLAKCEGEIAVELIDSPTGQSLKDNLSNYHVEPTVPHCSTGLPTEEGCACEQLCILDGNKYNTRVREAGEQRIEILDECEVLSNQKGEPLLIAAAANNDATSPRLRLKFSSANNTVPLKEVKVTESSESVLAGTKRPPFRLVVRALIAADGRRANIRPAVSEEFVFAKAAHCPFPLVLALPICSPKLLHQPFGYPAGQKAAACAACNVMLLQVVTKRTKNLKKQDIPSLDDPISKLNHIGKETVKKLNELKASAEEAQLDLPVPPELYRVTKVREFQKLARNSEADGHLQQKLKQLLKLSKEKWDAACEHAKIAVQARSPSQSTCFTS
ncbi:hypothetical protein MMC07_000402 [Pseudocyphellaria aurata]|nr:hypothetical protein [Pseudocyphellaria aurata]